MSFYLSAEQCRAGRKMLGWSQQKLADMAGISKSIVARLESGRSEQVRLRTKEAVCGIFERHGVFFGQDGSMDWDVSRVDTIFKKSVKDKMSTRRSEA